MSYYLSIAFVLFSFTPARIPSVGAHHAVPTSDGKRTWAKEDLERLSKVPGLISVVGQPTNEVSRGVEAPASQSNTEDPAWYAVQASYLNVRLEAQQADLRGFTKALDDARELKSTTGGVNLAEYDIGITPEATIDILQKRLTKTQTEFDELEDLARHKGIPPGVLRGPGRAGRQKRQLQQRSNRNTTSPPLKVIYEDFEEKFGIASFVVIAFCSGANRLRLRAPDRPIGRAGYGSYREAVARRIAANGGTDCLVSR